MVAHFIAALFTGYMVYVAQPGSSLFSWHPTLMTLSFAALMFEAILVFSPESSLFGKSKRSFKVQLHWILQTVAAVLGCVSFALIYLNKEHAGKPHFTTWHSWCGLTTVIYTLIQCLAGTVVKYPSLAKGFRLADLKIYHATSGLCLYSLVCVTLALGLFSNWFTKNVEGIPWYVCAGSISIIALTVMNQIVTAYLPRTQGRTVRK